MPNELVDYSLIADEIWIPFELINNSKQASSIIVFIGNKCKIYLTEFDENNNIGPIGFNSIDISIDDIRIEKIRINKNFVKIIPKLIYFTWVYTRFGEEKKRAISRIVFEDETGAVTVLSEEQAVYPYSLTLC